jgi:hypothetical protein
LETISSECPLRLGPTSQRVHGHGSRWEPERAALTLAFVFAGVVTVAWVMVLFLGIRWLVTAIF